MFPDMNPVNLPLLVLLLVSFVISLNLLRVVLKGEEVPLSWALFHTIVAALFVGSFFIKHAWPFNVIIALSILCIGNSFIYSIRALNNSSNNSKEI